MHLRRWLRAATRSAIAFVLIHGTVFAGRRGSSAWGQGRLGLEQGVSRDNSHERANLPQRTLALATGGRSRRYRAGRRLGLPEGAGPPWSSNSQTLYPNPAWKDKNRNPDVAWYQREFTIPEGWQGRRRRGLCRIPQLLCGRVSRRQEGGRSVLPPPARSTSRPPAARARSTSCRWASKQFPSTRWRRPSRTPARRRPLGAGWGSAVSAATSSS